MFGKIKLLFENIKDNFMGSEPDINIETDAEFFDNIDDGACRSSDGTTSGCACFPCAVK